MDVSQITQMIGSLGFPIACCCVLFWQNSKLQETLTAITVTMERMSERLSAIESEVKNGC